MDWGKIIVEDQRYLFINDYIKKKFNLSTLCRQYSISRTCAYKWIKRYEEEGIEGLKDRSKTPFNSPSATPDFITEHILNLKYAQSSWGPKKILGDLKKYKPDIVWPCLTTIENILKKHGLVERKKTRMRLAKAINPLGECNNSNDVWCMDFKGWWLTKDQQKCEPFTLTDAFSRYLLCCQRLEANNYRYTWAVFDRLFREYGLPLRIRSDNGAPFATLGAGRLSRLSINLIKAGVTPEWIDPGQPQQNGRHERMHLTLKQEGVDLNRDLRSQLKKLEEFSHYFNFIRPHEALEQKCPGEVYITSSRNWDGRLRSPEYSSEYKTNVVKNNGGMAWRGRVIYVGRAFEGEPVGIIEKNDNFEAYYGPFFLGVVKDWKLEVTRRGGRVRK